MQKLLMFDAWGGEACSSRFLKANILRCCRLETLKEEEWNDDVTVVSCDMREWDAPEKVGF